MSNVTNLNQFRKKKARTEKKARADANAAAFGRTKAEKRLDQAQTDKARRDLDAHRVDDDGDQPE